MNATDLVKDFAARGLADSWLTHKQTAFLVSLCRRNRTEYPFDPQHHTYSGTYWEPDGTVVTWFFYLSPLNRRTETGNHQSGKVHLSRYTPEQAATDQAKADYDARCRVFNDGFSALVAQGAGPDELRAYVLENAASV